VNQEGQKETGPAKDVSPRRYPASTGPGLSPTPRSSQLRVLPPVVMELSPEDFEEVTDLLAELILERMHGEP